MKSYENLVKRLDCVKHEPSLFLLKLLSLFLILFLFFPVSCFSFSLITFLSTSPHIITIKHMIKLYKYYNL